MTEKIKSFLFHNTSQGQTVLKNTFWLSFGQLSSRLIRAVIIIFAARILGAAGYGVFSYALSLAGFFTIFSDIGITAFLTREGSKGPEFRERFIATGFVTKLVLIAANSVVILLAAPLLTKTPGVAELLPIAIILFAFDSIRDFTTGIARSLERMEIEASVLFIMNVSVLLLGLAALFAFPNSFVLMCAYTVGSGIGMAFSLWKLRVHFKNIFSRFDLSVVKTLITEAWPFGVAGLLNTVMLNTDTIMLGWWRTPEEIGYYSAAQRIIMLLYLLPGFIAVSTFPTLARLAKENAAAFRTVLEKALRAIFFMAFPLIAGGVVVADPLIRFIFGPEYAPTGPVLRILLFTFIVVFPGALIGNAIFSYNKQKYLIYAFTLGAFGNVALNALLIPRFGIEGSAAATIITQILSNGCAFLIMHRINPFRVFALLPRIILASVIMGVCAYFLLLAGSHIVVILAISILVYIAALWLLKEKLVTDLRTQMRSIFG